MPNSIGGELGLLPGTELLAINGRALEDFLDWEFHSADERFLLQARLPGGAEMEYDIERPEGIHGRHARATANSTLRQPL